MSSCFSPLRNAKPYESQFEPPTSLATEKLANYLKYESVINSKSTGENISSGMETSKMSVFSPVLSSTIMHAPDKPERLSPIMALRNPLDISNGNNHGENVEPGAKESNYGQNPAPECSLIEKVSNIFSAMNMQSLPL